MASLRLALSVDSNNPNPGDLYLENGTVQITSVLSQEVAQQLYVRFRFQLGEWFLDPTLGFPWFQLVLGVKTPKSLVDQLIKSVITGCPGVASLTTYNSNFSGQTRVLNVTFSCALTDGTTITSSDFGDFTVAAVT